MCFLVLRDLVVKNPNELILPLRMHSNCTRGVFGMYPELTRNILTHTKTPYMFYKISWLIFLTK